MKKIRTVLHSNIFFIIAILVTLIYTLLFTSFSAIKTKVEKTINITIRDYQIQEDKILIKAKDTIIYLPIENESTVAFGSNIILKGEYTNIATNTNFNLFNYKNYLRGQGIKYQFLASEVLSSTKTKNPFFIIKNKLYKHLEKTPQSKPYLMAFIFGKKDLLNEEVLASYQKNGVSHLLVISGTHIILITSIIKKILKNFNLGYIKNNKIIITILLLYLFVTGFAVSAARAILFYIIVFINKTKYLDIKKPRLLIFLACAFLIYNPYLIYNLSFLLSFVITFFIISFAKGDGSYIGNVFNISLLSFFAAFPIIINSFFEVNFLAPVINIIFVPLVTIILFPLSFLTYILPFLDTILIFLLNITENLTLLISNNINLNLIFKKPDILTILVYYILFYYMLKANTKKNKIIFILMIFLYYNINYLNPFSTVSIIDVGEGDSALIKLKHNQGNILIDTGDKDSYHTVVSYLKSEGIRTIDYLILTHGDSDHLGEVGSITGEFKTNKILINYNEKNENETNDNYIQIEKEDIYINNNYFHLVSYNQDNENDSSIILYGLIENKRLLFLGDISKIIEEKYINQFNINNIDLLKVAHHGSKTSTSKAFIKKINPQIATISYGKNNYGHPNVQTLDTLKKNNSIVLTTGDNGMIIYNLTLNKIKVVNKQGYLFN